MKTYTYTINITPDNEGNFIVTVPALQGCHTFGKTIDEAIVNAREAIQCYLESLVKEGDPIPKEQKSFPVMLDVSLTAFVA